MWVWRRRLRDGLRRMRNDRSPVVLRIEDIDVQKTSIKMKFPSVRRVLYQCVGVLLHEDLVDVVKSKNVRHAEALSGGRLGWVLLELTDLEYKVDS